MKRFAKLNLESEARNERADCTVKAVALVTGLTYSECHEALADVGRKNRQGLPYHFTRKAIQGLGFDVKDYYPASHSVSSDEREGVIPVRIKTATTAERYLPSNGRFLLGMNGHIAAVVDGKLEDWTAGRRHPLIRLSEVVPKGVDLPVNIDKARRVSPWAQQITNKSGSIKNLIWETAERYYDERIELEDFRGVPPVKWFLGVRRDIMDALETGADINRNTCSVELGKWQAVKIDSLSK